MREVPFASAAWETFNQRHPIDSRPLIFILSLSLSFSLSYIATLKLTSLNMDATFATMVVNFENLLGGGDLGDTVRKLKVKLSIPCTFKLKLVFFSYLLTLSLIQQLNSIMSALGVAIYEKVKRVWLKVSVLCFLPPPTPPLLTQCCVSISISNRKRRLMIAYTTRGLWWKHHSRGYTRFFLANTWAQTGCLPLVCIDAVWSVHHVVT